MKLGRFTLVLAGWMCPAMMLGAADLAVNENPYTPIVTRNIFGLIPIPTNPPVDVNANTTPPPKITANGIMTIFGTKEALFKVATPPKPGQPPGDQSYVLSEGESQDDIAVVKIDDQADVITFNNHGTIQVLPLSAAPNLNTPVSGGKSVPMPVAGGAAGRFPRPFGGAGFGGRRGIPAANAGNENSAASQPSGNNNYNEVPGSGGAYGNNSELNGLSPEAQALLIEQNRIDTQDQVRKGLLPPLPPTPITPADATGAGDAPLINAN